jgi:hypothetical protein
VTTAETWEPFGIPDEAYTDAADGRGQKILNISWRKPRSEREAGRKSRAGGDPSRAWLRSALAGLGVLAAAAAAVSFAAQYHLVFAAKGIAWASALEAGIPDAGSMVFACLGIALALKGKRALRARGGNLACVGLSLTMNLIAAAAGWRGVAIWVMPSAVYAFASDTLIGVIRAHVLASQNRADDEKTALAVLGGLLLWALRLFLAPKSTLTGFRTWVIEAAPVAPGRTAPAAAAAAAAPIVAALPAAPETPGSAAITSIAPDHPETPSPGGRAAQPVRRRVPRGESKTARFLALVKDRHGELAGINPAKVSRISTDLAPEVGLNAGAARAALRPLVLAARGGAS